MRLTVAPREPPSRPSAPSWPCSTRAARYLWVPVPVSGHELESRRWSALQTESSRFASRCAAVAADPETLSNSPGNCSNAERGLLAEYAEAGVKGFVSLVGAGPGDPGLITVLGARRLF